MDDKPMMREGVRAVLSADPRFDIVGECATAREALRLFSETRPDLVLMDGDLKRENGLAATAALRARYPAARVLLLSIRDGARLTQTARRVGAAGVIGKGVRPEALARAVAAAAKSRGAAPLLTARELETLALVAEGLDGGDIAQRLGVGVRTVQKHRENVMRKLKVRGTAALVRYAVSSGLLRLDGEPG